MAQTPPWETGDLGGARAFLCSGTPQRRPLRSQATHDGVENFLLLVSSGPPLLSNYRRCSPTTSILRSSQDHQKGDTGIFSESLILRILRLEKEGKEFSLHTHRLTRASSSTHRAAGRLGERGLAQPRRVARSFTNNCSELIHPRCPHCPPTVSSYATEPTVDLYVTGKAANTD